MTNYIKNIGSSSEFKAKPENNMGTFQGKAKQIDNFMTFLGHCRSSPLQTSGVGPTASLRGLSFIWEGSSCQRGLGSLSILL